MNLMGRTSRSGATTTSITAMLWLVRLLAINAGALKPVRGFLSGVTHREAKPRDRLALGSTFLGQATGSWYPAPSCVPKTADDLGSCALSNPDLTALTPRLWSYADITQAQF